jgi:hypothetical protein
MPWMEVKTTQGVLKQEVAASVVSQKRSKTEMMISLNPTKMEARTISSLF